MPHHPVPDQVDVVVIGGGVSGLRAARSLVALGLEPVVLEARERVGGRTWSTQIGEGVFDLGGQWLGPTQRRAYRLAKDLGSQTFPTFCQGKKILDLGGRVSTYKRTIPKMSVGKLFDMHLTIRRLNRMTKAVPLHNPAAAKRASRLDAQSLETWKQRHIRTRAARELIDVAVRVVFGAEASELSLLHFLFYLRSGGNMMRLIEIKDGAQQDRFVMGAQSLALGMAEALAERVCLATPVHTISQDDEGVTVESTRGTVRAKRAIVAAPPAVVSRIRFDPALPASRGQLIQRVPMGSTVKVLITYDQPFWRSRGFSGEVTCTKGPASVIFDNCSHENKQPALVAFIVARHARTWGDRSYGDRRRALLSQISRYFGPEAEQPTHLVEQDWNAEPYTRGCRVGVVAPGVLTTFGTNLRLPVGRIHWAGTETATEWNGYIEGALQAGERAADEVATRFVEA
jgi:monoamine oxidase